jgi:hypothetical protein
MDREGILLNADDNAYQAHGISLRRPERVAMLGQSDSDVGVRGDDAERDRGVAEGVNSSWLKGMQSVRSGLSAIIRERGELVR